jgi:hypothetical protein
MAAPQHAAEPLKGRDALICALGARDAESAIRIANLSRNLDRYPRNRDALIRYLRGATLREVGAQHGVSGEQARGLIWKARRTITNEMRAPETGARVLNGLSVRAQNCLSSEICPVDRSRLADERVRDWVRENGARALLAVPNMGRKTYLEICDAFGFDPTDQVREGPVEESPVRHEVPRPFTGVLGRLFQESSEPDTGPEPL